MFLIESRFENEYKLLSARYNLKLGFPHAHERSDHYTTSEKDDLKWVCWFRKRVVTLYYEMDRPIRIIVLGLHNFHNGVW